MLNRELIVAQVHPHHPVFLRTPFLATLKINPQLQPLPNHSKVLRNKDSNDLSPMSLLKQLGHIKKERKHTMAHPHTIYPFKTSPSSHYLPQRKNYKRKCSTPSL